RSAKQFENVFGAGDQRDFEPVLVAAYFDGAGDSPPDRNLPRRVCPAPVRAATVVLRHRRSQITSRSSAKSVAVRAPSRPQDTRRHAGASSVPITFVCLTSPQPVAVYRAATVAASGMLRFPANPRNALMPAPINAAGYLPGE